MTGSTWDEAAFGLTEAELQEVAHEAGLTKQELQQALLEQRQQGHRFAPPIPFGSVQTSTSVRGRVPISPANAAEKVRRAIESTLGGRRSQTTIRSDTAIEARGLTYKIAAEEDGEGGALVRIDLDSSAAVADHAMWATGIGGISATAMLLGCLFSATVLAIGATIGLVGGLLVAHHAMRLATMVRNATTTAANALLAAEVDGIGTAPGG